MATAGTRGGREDVVAVARKTIAEYSAGELSKDVIEALAQNIEFRPHPGYTKEAVGTEIVLRCKSIVDAMIEVRKEISDYSKGRFKEEVIASLVQKTLLALITQYAERRDWSLPGLMEDAKKIIEALLLAREDDLRRISARIVEYATFKLQGDRSAAEDLAQETVVLLNTKYAHLGSLNEMVGCAINIVKNKLFGVWRERARQSQFVPVGTHEEGGVDIVDPLSEIRSVREHSELAELQGRIKKALESCKPRCRALLTLLLDGYSQVEIARLINRPVNTIYTWVSRCVRQLRTTLDLQGQPES